MSADPRPFTVAEQAAMLTNTGIAKLGFRPIQEGSSITARFHLIRVYQVIGLPVELGEGQVLRFSSNPEYDIVLGSSINEMTNSLLGGMYADDEGDWRKETKASPPFLLFHLRPTGWHTASEGWVKADGTELLTYNTFQVAREELRQRESLNVGSAMALIAAKLTAALPGIEFILRERVIFGLTGTGVSVHDMFITASGQATVHQPFGLPELDACMNAAVSDMSKPDEGTSSLYLMGIEEADNLKRFLFYYFFIERHVHRGFALLGLDRPSPASVPTRLSLTGAKVFARPAVEAKSVRDKLLWCARWLWVDLTDKDVETFSKLKKLRDHFAHGRRPRIGASEAQMVKSFAAKLLLSGSAANQAPGATVAANHKT